MHPEKWNRAVKMLASGAGLVTRRDYDDTKTKSQKSTCKTPSETAEIAAAKRLHIVLKLSYTNTI